MTVDQLVQRLDQFGQRATNLSDILAQIGTEITDSLKSRAPQNTGALKASINFSVDQDSLTLEMLNYGIFQNYGVEGVDSDPGVKPVEAGIFGISAGHQFKFKSKTIGGSLPFPVRRSIAERGLRPKSFFSIADLRREVALRLEEEISQSF